MDTLAEIEPDSVEPVQGNLNEIHSVADRSEDTTSVNESTEIEVRKDGLSIDGSCGPQSSKDSSPVTEKLLICPWCGIKISQSA